MVVYRRPLVNRNDSRAGMTIVTGRVPHISSPASATPRIRGVHLDFGLCLSF